jgi:hypothetical protein
MWRQTPLLSIFRYLYTKVCGSAASWLVERRGECRLSVERGGPAWLGPAPYSVHSHCRHKSTLKIRLFWNSCFWVHFVTKVSLHFWNLRYTRHDPFRENKFSSLFSGFLTVWEHKSPFQRLENRLKIFLKSYLMFIWLPNDDSVLFFWTSKKK